MTRLIDVVGHRDDRNRLGKVNHDNYLTLSNRKHLAGTERDRRQAISTPRRSRRQLCYASQASGRDGLHRAVMAKDEYVTARRNIGPGIIPIFVRGIAPKGGITGRSCYSRYHQVIQ